MWVELDQLPEDVWRCAPDGHLLVPVDVARTPDGLAAVVPHCPTRLSIGLAERATPGGTVTIAVSMVRAAAEARDHGFTEGSWWLDASGRPVLAVHDGAAWVDDGRDLLEHLAERAGRCSVRLWCGLRYSSAKHDGGTAMSRAARTSSSRRPNRSRSMGWMPRRAGTASFHCRFARPLCARRGSRRSPPRRSRGSRASPTPTGRVVWPRRCAALSRSPVVCESECGPTRGAFFAQIARRERKAERAERTHSSPSVRRRAPLLVAVAVGAVVIGGGLLWPEPERPAAADPQRASVEHTGLDATTPPVTTAEDEARTARRPRCSGAD
jgi:hypothetical protein